MPYFNDSRFIDKSKISILVITTLIIDIGNQISFIFQLFIEIKNEFK